MNELIRSFRTDLHVHTVLSPCAEVEMIPPLIVEYALDLGIDIIAITDHNSTANIEAVQKAAQGTNLVVLPGMEIQTREEVHSLCIFDTLKQIGKLQELVDQSLPSIKNRPEHFGEQFVVDQTGEFIRREEKLLLNSTNLSIDDVWKFVTELGGIFIPAHIDRKAFGLIENLGLIPTNIPIEALEISKHISPQEIREKNKQTKMFSLIQNGDVHRLEEFIGKTVLHITEPTVAEIRKALHCREGRYVSINGYSSSIIE